MKELTQKASQTLDLLRADIREIQRKSESRGDNHAVFAAMDMQEAIGKIDLLLARFIRAEIGN